MSEDSAPTALDQSTASYFAAPKIINYGPALANNAIPGPCFSSGDVQVETDAENRVSRITYNACSEDFGPGFSSLTDGVVTFEYDAGGTLTGLIMDDFSEETVLGDDNQQVRFDGTMEFPNGPSSPPSYTANGDYRFIREFPSDNQNVAMSFKDFVVESSVSGTDIIQIMSGRLSLPDGDTYLTVDTGDTGLRRPSGSSCATAGTLTLTAEDGSYTSVTFNGEDHIVVSVNGVAQPERTCDEYLAFIED
ncbi:hypothetical protein ACLD02_04800 [Alloalcanivorax sp. C16-2]|uniref:hypothetical protein n=1 Tax=Alloalcanivorax TaxID=3020832 RepID=UPI00193435C8|nr:hypothetical protein [Alloalcanivorax marinus]